MIRTPGARRALRALLFTVVALGAVATVRPASAQQGLSLTASERAEILAYTLTMDGVKRLATTSAALTRELAADPSFRATMEAASGQGLTAQAALLERLPKAAATLRAAGLTARGYAIGSRALGSAEAISQMRASGQPVPSMMDAMFPTSAAQLAFVAAHRAEIVALVPQFLGVTAHP